MDSRGKTVVSALVACVAVGLTVYLSRDRAVDLTPDAPPTRAATQLRTPPPNADATIQDAVLYDGVWRITEGVWALTDQSFPKVWGRTSSNGLLREAGPRALWIMAPGMYGGFPTRFTSHTTEPPAPSWCEDVVEAPLHSTRGTVAFMGFENMSDGWPIGAGDFRVRLCAAGLDDRHADPERPGSHGRSSSRLELQIWPVARTPGQIVLVGSEYAEEAHAELRS